MREKNSRFKAIIKQNDSDFVKKAVIWHGEVVTHHGEFIVAKNSWICETPGVFIVKSNSIRDMLSEFRVNSRDG